MTSIERRLKEYGASTQISGNASDKNLALTRAKEAFFTQREKLPAGWFAFFYVQSRFIRKRWLFGQLLLLILLYPCLQIYHDAAAPKLLGVTATMFVLLVVPELWKNKSQSATEIEGTCFYSLRQVYLARMLVFAVFDGIVLCGFSGAVMRAALMQWTDIVFHFFLPMIVTCCICLKTLGSRLFTSEYTAVFLSLLWTALWTLFILQDSVYDLISVPLWTLICIVAFLYFIYSICRLLKECDACPEGGLEQWN